MAQAEEQNKKQHTAEDLPDTIWDEYEGQYVVVQLSAPYFAVTHPGEPARVSVEKPDGSRGIEFLPMPVLVGILSVKKDLRGQVRITLLMRDPDPEKSQAGARVRIDLPTDMIGPISITSPPEDKSESPIIL